MMKTPSFFFFRNYSKKSKSELPPYPRRAVIAVLVAIPMAFSLNVPLNEFGAILPVWSVIMINAIVIPSYMTFIIPKASKRFASWLNSEKRRSA